jgi:nucleoside-diphosphate-sugar epimerase
MRSGNIERVTVLRGDVCDRELIERALGEYEIDTVFHLAAQTIVGVANRNPIPTFKSNIAGTWNLLEACRRSPTVKAVIVASSDKAYGDQLKLPYAEGTPLEGRHPYDVSKSCADLISEEHPGAPSTVDPLPSYGQAKRVSEFLCTMYASLDSMRSSPACSLSPARIYRSISIL